MRERERDRDKDREWRILCEPLQGSVLFTFYVGVWFFLVHLNHQTFQRVFFLQLTPFCQRFIWLFHHFVFVFNTLTLCLSTPYASTQRVACAKHARRAITQFEQTKFEALLLLLMFFLAIGINYSYNCRVYVCKSWDN